MSRKKAPPRTDPYTAAEVAEREGVSTKRIHALVRQDRIPGVTRHGIALVIPVDYQILPPPLRPGRQRQGAS